MTNEERKVFELALEALQMLHDENMDYLTRNKLGGENNQCMVFARETITAIKKALAQGEQEPVACVQDLGEVKRKHLVYEKGMDWKDPLYTTQPQGIYYTPPQRKPLSDEQLKEIWLKGKDHGDDWLDVQGIARAIEAAHGIKE